MLLDWFISFLVFISLLKLTINFLQSFFGLIQPSIYAEPLITLTSMLTVFDCYLYIQRVFISPNFFFIIFVTNLSHNSLFSLFNPFYFFVSLKPVLYQYPLFWSYISMIEYTFRYMLICIFLNMLIDIFSSKY